MRIFEEVKRECLKFPDVKTKIPERATSHSAGYDFCSKEDFVIPPHSEYLTWTDVKAKMFFDNVLEIYPRSGNAIKFNIIIKNTVGIIDSDYYNNSANDGNIGICLVNNGDKEFHVGIGDRIAQGVFGRYLITDDDKFIDKETTNDNNRSGGFGSTGR